MMALTLVSRAIRRLSSSLYLLGSFGMYLPVAGVLSSSEESSSDFPLSALYRSQTLGIKGPSCKIVGYLLSTPSRKSIIRLFHKKKLLGLNLGGLAIEPLSYETTLKF
ncbi:hypothetical protein L6452_15459 [Arctium lappa]|uniref:Uncharacterized protein n=1 Tax=Arctium lappa TaxID=4217 RepID=A0ACB9CNS8_ARCLA|nr:hypothetical protein L6452_15459 [Arctium lappa]